MVAHTVPSSSPQEMRSFKACTADADAQSQTVQCMCISEDTGCVQPQFAEACTCSMCNCHHPLTTSAEKPSVAHTAPSHDSQATKSRLFQANTNKPELVCSHLSSQHSGCLQANGSQKCTPTPPRPSNATPHNDCALPNTRTITAACLRKPWSTIYAFHPHSWLLLAYAQHVLKHRAHRKRHCNQKMSSRYEVIAKNMLHYA